MNDNDDKREFERFMLKDGAYAISSSMKSNEILGQVIDIGLGGLSFSYIDYENRYESVATTDIDLFISGTGFYFNNIRTKTIYDIVMPSKSSFSSLPLRRRGVQFLDLSKQEKSSLGTFIEEYADNAA